MGHGIDWDYKWGPGMEEDFWRGQIEGSVVSEIWKRGHICTCERAQVQMYPTYDLCNMHCGLVSKHTPNLVTFGPYIPEL